MELFVVATPIGNLGDLSPRVRETLSSVDVIAAEDTRRTQQLLDLVEIKKPKLVSFYDHNESVRTDEIISYLKNGSRVALVTDAGTPCISDPGYRLVAAAHAEKIRVTPIPGPSALTTIVQASGLPSDCFTFVGFLPRKGLKDVVQSWQQFPGSVVFFESGPRILDSFAELKALYPEAPCAVGRELTKLHEEVVSLTCSEVHSWLANHQALKGEFACIIDLRLYRQNRWTKEQLEGEIKTLLAAGESTKDIARELTQSGWSKDEIYKLALHFKKS